MTTKRIMAACGMIGLALAGCTVPKVVPGGMPAPPPPAATASHQGMGPAIDTSKLMPVGNGRPELLLKRGEMPGPNPEGVGTFRFDCEPTHMAFDDPIVYPGQPGAAHLHTFFGNTAVDAHTTTDSLRNSGNSSCRGGVANRSGYWVPTVIDTTSGAPITPDYLQVYYKTGYGGVAPSQVSVIPSGLRMISGDARATAPQADLSLTSWSCPSVGNGARFASIPSTCAAGDLVNMMINFPQCWDGVNLDSPDHMSHMASAVDGCPASHPVAIPAITFNVRYRVPAGGLPSWRLASDMYGSDQPGGYSLHADWWNGWNEDIIRTITQNCLQRSLECQMDLLGDGRMLG